MSPFSFCPSDGCFVQTTWNQSRASWGGTSGASWWSTRSATTLATTTWSKWWNGCPRSGCTSTSSLRLTARLTSPSDRGCSCRARLTSQGHRSGSLTSGTTRSCRTCWKLSGRGYRWVSASVGSGHLGVMLRSYWGHTEVIRRSGHIGVVLGHIEHSMCSTCWKLSGRGYRWVSASVVSDHLGVILRSYWAYIQVISRSY